MTRLKLVFIMASVVALTAIAAVTTAMAPDARLAQCGDGLLGNTAKEAFEIPDVSRIWDNLPAMGQAPELATKTGSAFVVLFDTYSGFGAGGLISAKNVVCVIDASGQMSVYADVSKAGLTIR